MKIQQPDTTPQPKPQPKTVIRMERWGADGTMLNTMTYSWDEEIEIVLRPKAA